MPDSDLEIKFGSSIYFVTGLGLELVFNASEFRKRMGF